MAVAVLNDMAVLATDTVFGNRVLMSLLVYASNTVPNEAISASSLSLHVARKNFAAQIPSNPNLYKPLFVNAVAANQTVANDATAGGTVVGMTPTALAAAALLCTDTDINNAVAAAFNSFVPGI